MHAPIHIDDAPNIDKTEDKVVVEFIDKYHTCALPIETKYSETSNLVKNQLACRKKGVASRSNAPWTLSDKTNIVHSEEKIDEAMVKQSKKLFEKVLSHIVTISDLSDVAQSEILKEWSYSRTV